MPIMEGTFLFIEIQDQTLLALCWHLELLGHPVVSIDAGVGAGVPVHGLAHLLEQLRGLLREGAGGAELAGHVLAVVTVVVLTWPADQANSLENWKQKGISPGSREERPEAIHSKLSYNCCRWCTHKSRGNRALRLTQRQSTRLHHRCTGQTCLCSHI